MAETTPEATTPDEPATDDQGLTEPATDEADTEEAKQPTPEPTQDEKEAEAIYNQRSRVDKEAVDNPGGGTTETEPE